VLAGADTQAAYYHWNRRHFLLRWYYAESETELLDHFHDVWNQVPVEAEVRFRHPGGTLLLMDSTDLPGRWLNQRTEFELPRARYRVLTTHSETKETYIIIHEFRRDRPEGRKKKQFKVKTRTKRRRGGVEREPVRTRRCT